jgi:hypothetical protein
MLSARRTPVRAPTGRHVSLPGRFARSLRGEGEPARGPVRTGSILVRHDGLGSTTADPASATPGEVAEWQTRTVQVRVPGRA